MMNNVNEFDFTKKGILDKINKQSYNKLAFLVLGFSVLGFSAYNVSTVVSDKIKQNTAIEQQENKLIIKNIKAMTEQEFTNMLQYISKNTNIYDKKVSLLQDSIINTYKEEGFRFSLPTQTAEKLGFLLTQYKEKTQADIANLNKVRMSVEENIEVSTQDINLFLKYMSGYKAKNKLNYGPLDDKIHTIMTVNESGNIQYNKDNQIHEKLKEIDNEINDFQFILENPIVNKINKPKM